MILRHVLEIFWLVFSGKIGEVEGESGERNFVKVGWLKIKIWDCFDWLLISGNVGYEFMNFWTVIRKNGDVWFGWK